MAKNKKSLINLLPQEEFDVSVVGRVLKWAMGTFRIIVIITEVIVMGAFLSRFWLDAQNSDLNDTIAIKTAQITSQSNFENQFRAIQNKLSIFKQLAAAPKPSDRIGDLASRMPADIVISGMSVQDSSAELKGTSASELGIAQFVSNLQDDKLLKNVDLGSLGSSPDNESLTVFTVSVGY